MDNEQQEPDNDRTQLSGTRGLVSWVQRITGRSLGDVRIHDSTQAGELARRLGARAFAAGRDIYVRPELVEPLTPEGAALLAHELYHVAEQSGGGLSQEAVMPLLRPSGAPSFGYSAGAGEQISTPAPGGIEGASVQRQVGGLRHRPAPQVQRALGTTTSSETTAEAVAGAAAQAMQPQRRRAASPPPDPEAIADLVYEQMAHELRLDRERGLY